MKKLLLVGTLLMGSNMLFAGGDSLTPVEPATELPETTIEDTSSRLYNVGLKVGTLGVGIDVSTPINDSFAFRVNVNGATYSHSATEEEIDYDADLKFANAGVLVDYFPFESVGFHLSAGAYYNANKIEAQGVPNGTYTIDGKDYAASDIGSLDAKLDFDKFAPYVGLGWGNDSRSEGFGFSLDLGMLVGKTHTDLTATRGSTADDTTWAEIQDSVAAEKEKLDDDLDRLKVYPVIMVGITYTF